MKHRLHRLKIMVLACCLTVVPMAVLNGFAQSATASQKTATGDKSSTIESQIREMRRQLQQQQEEIDLLKRQLQERDRGLQQTRETVQPTPPLATQTAEGYDNLQQAVHNIQSELDRSKQTVSQVKQEQKNLNKAISHPDEFHYKGITISPHGSFIEGATIYRSSAIGGDINSAPTSTPLEHSNAAQMSEFYGSGRQSRIAIKATGKLPSMDLTGYYEMDFLGAAVNSNSNQSNSYVSRQRQVWARAALNNGWSFIGGQMWSLVTETKQGMENGTEALPTTIDPEYNVGFNWTRQYGFRVSRNFHNRFWLGASVENAQTLNPAGNNLPTSQLLGSAGNGGGQYNSTTNYSFNLAPDFVAKAVWQPGWGHYELFGLARFFRDRVYPTGGTPYNDSMVAGGVGGGFRVPAFHRKVTIGLKGMYGQGVGRYADSTIADVTLRPSGQIAPLSAFSALGTLEFNPTKRLSIWSNYGGDYVGRRYLGNEGYGSPLTDMTGCNVEPSPTGSFSPGNPSHCSGNTKDVQELSAGYWFNFYDGDRGMLRQAIQYSHFRRDLWSGIGGVTNPGGGAHGSYDAFWTSFRYYLP